jgi:putative ABC transport system permease protein
MRNELRSAYQQLRRRPGFALGAALSLAIGMSLATALFSVIDSALFKPLPYAEPQRLVYFYETTVVAQMASVPAKLALALSLSTDVPSVSDAAAFVQVRPIVGRSGEARRVDAMRVSPSFFKTLRVAPLRGTVFTKADSHAGARTVVLGYAMWAHQFGAESRVIGRTIPIDGAGHTIIGVMPATFGFGGAQFWLPLDEDALARDAAAARDPGYRWYQVFGRLAPGATLEQLNAELPVVYQRLFENSEAHRGRSSTAGSFADFQTGVLRFQLRLWAGAAVLILILCAVNFTTMSLARGMQRRDDIAIRAALGASKVRIVRMLLAEAMLMAVLAGAMAVVLAWWLLSFVNAIFANDALDLSLSMSWMTVGLGVLATVVVGFVFALAPAVELAKVDLRSMMQSGSSSTTSNRSDLRGRRGLVALQLCLALTAVAVVASLIKADKRYQTAEAVIDYSQVVIGTITPIDSSVPSLDLTPFVDELRRSPAISNAAIIGRGRTVTALPERNEPFGAALAEVSSGFFSTLGVRPIAGRLPIDAEIDQGSVVVMTRSTAVRGFGTIDAAVGQRLRVKPPGKPQIWVAVVGVVPDLSGGGLFELFGSMYTITRRQVGRAGIVVARVTGQPQTRLKELSAILADADPRLAMTDARTMRSIVERARGATRGRTIFLTAVAVLALLLAVVGMYGLTSYTTELRARELGIRVALGAGRWHLARILLGELWWMSVLGVVAGVLASGRVVAFLDALFRNPMMRGPLVTLSVVPTIACASTLLVVLLLGTAVPLRRVLHLDVMRVMQRG